jgi:hypothetical protein
MCQHLCQECDIGNNIDNVWVMVVLLTSLKVDENWFYVIKICLIWPYKGITMYIYLCYTCKYAIGPCELNPYTVTCNTLRRDGNLIQTTTCVLTKYLYILIWILHTYPALIIWYTLIKPIFQWNVLKLANSDAREQHVCDTRCSKEIVL